MSTPLKIRQQIINRLLALYSLYPKVTSEEQVLLAQEIAALENALAALDRNLAKVSYGMTSKPGTGSVARSSGETQAIKDARQNRQRLKRSEIAQLLSQTGIEEFRTATYEWVDEWQKTMAMLQDFSAGNRGALLRLGIHNPFGIRDQVKEVILGYQRYGYESLREFVDKQNEIAAAYTDQGVLDGLITPLPLYQNQKAVEAWVQIEQSAQEFSDSPPNLVIRFHPDGTNRSQQDFIASGFAQKAALRLWRQICRLAKYEDMRNQLQATSNLFSFNGEQNPLLPGRHMPDSEGCTNLLIETPASAIPRFVDENGDAYANTQVLCWRYRKGDSSKLSPLLLDQISQNLTSIGLLFTDSDGRPTMVKPDFLLKPEHRLELQVRPIGNEQAAAGSNPQADPQTADVLLLETSTGDKPEGFISNDPLLANWFSYGLPEHQANINNAIGLVGDKQVLQVTDLESQRKLENLGIDKNKEGTLSEVLSATSLTGLYALTEGYEYGFMVLPLGHGSLAIKDIVSLPERQWEGAPVAIRQSLSAGEQEVTLPRTIRQFNHECFQVRNGLYNSHIAMMEANSYKHSDIIRLEKLKTWVDYNVDFPAKGKSKLRPKAWATLKTALSDMQEGIRRTQFRRLPMLSLNDPDDAAKYHIYKKQLTTAEAFVRYEAWVKKGMALLDNEPIMQRIGLWSKAQEDMSKQTLQSSGQQWLSQANIVTGSSDDQTNPSFLPLSWQPPSTQLPDMESPYTPLVYDGVLGVISLLSQSHMDEELYGRLLLPAIHSWISSPEVSDLAHELDRALADAQSGFASKALKLDQKQIQNELKENQSPLEYLLGGKGADAAKMAFGVAKGTFIRGPGAPALLEGILELASMLLPTVYNNHPKVQMNIMLRIQVLQIMSISRMHLTVNRKQLTVLVSLTLRPKKWLKLGRLLNPQALARRVYPESTWGAGHVQGRIESAIKTVLFFTHKCQQLSRFMDSMDEEKWQNPSESDFRNAAYQYLVSAQSALDETSTLLATPGMVRFLNQIGALNKLKGGHLERVVVKLFTAELDDMAQRGATMVFGSDKGTKLAKWLIKTKSGNAAVFRVMGTWADRISFAASAVACVASTVDAVHYLSNRREYQMMRSTIEAIGYGMVAAGAIINSMGALITVNAIPGVGQVLFVAGTIILVGMIVWDYYWEHWGRAHFYSDTFVIFDDQWTGLADAGYFNEYTSREYGANELTIEAYRTINDTSQSTIVDVIDILSYGIKLYATVQTNNAIHTHNALSSLFHGKQLAEKKIDPYPADVEWKNFNWLVVARLLERHDFLTQSDGNLVKEDACKVIDLDNETDRNFGRALKAGSDDAKETAKENLYDLIYSLYQVRQQYREAGGDAPADVTLTAEVIWPALVNGTFPKEYEQADLLEKATYPTLNQKQVKDFLQRWKQLV